MFHPSLTPSRPSRSLCLLCSSIIRYHTREGSVSRYDIINANNIVDDTGIRILCKQVDETNRPCFEHAARIAAELSHSVSLQRYRINPPGTSVIAHYRFSIALPFLDQVVSEFKEQFTGISLTASKLLVWYHLSL